MIKPDELDSEIDGLAWDTIAAADESGHVASDASDQKSDGQDERHRDRGEHDGVGRERRVKNATWRTRLSRLCHDDRHLGAIRASVGEGAVWALVAKLS